MQQTETRLYARYEDGGFPVIHRGSDYVIERPEGTLIYQTKRQVIVSLTGHPKGRNWTWERYFKQGKHQPRAAVAESWATGSVFELFAPAAPTVIIKKEQPLGIDLAKRGIEVKKLLFAGFGAKIKSAGYDPEDVLQEVYKGILVRNRGKCPFDARKASFGHYVHLVCECIVSNYHRKMSRQRRVEPIADEADELALDQAEGRMSAETDDLMADDFAATLSEESPWGDMGPSLTARVLPYVRAGFGRTEIADMLKLPKTAVSKALAELRQEAQHWGR